MGAFDRMSRPFSVTGIAFLGGVRDDDKGFIFDPDSRFPRSVHYSFSDDAGFVFDQSARSTAHFDFSTDAGFIFQPIATFTHYSFSTDAGFVYDDYGSGATPDDPAEPDVIDTAPIVLTVEHEITAGTNAECVIVGAVGAGFGPGSRLIIGAQFTGTPDVIGADFRMPYYTSSGSTGASYYATPSEPRGLSLYRLSHIATSDSLTIDLFGASWEYANVSQFGAYANASVSTGTVSAAPVTRFWLPGHSSPVEYDLYAVGADRTLAGPIASLVSAMESDGLHYCVGLSGYDDGFLDERFTTARTASISISIQPMLRSGRFRFALYGASEVSAWLDLTTCTAAQIQSALDDMPTVEARGGMTVRHIGRPVANDIRETARGIYTDYSFFTPSNELLIQF